MLFACAGATLAAEKDVQEFRSSGGLRVLLRRVPGAGRVALVTLFDIGGDHDPQGRSGLAHFVEHLHVTAAAGPTPARTYAELVKRYAGQANAQTGFRYTVVAQVFPKGALHTEILDAAARMRELKITQADVDRERPRVLTELANMYERLPALAAANQARLLVRPTASGGRHGGTPAEVERMTLAELRAFHAKYYKLRNAILVLAGEFDPAAARAAIEKAFADVPAGEAAPAPTKHIALFPGDPEECFYFSVSAFDIAERFQTPVFVVSDLDIGMNDWMVPRLEWDEGYTPDRGKVLTAEDLEMVEAFHRYEDVDGDSIPYRTLPGVHPKGAYFTRGSGHDRYGRYTEDTEAYTDVVDRIARKIESAAAAVPEPEVRMAIDAPFGLVTIGACRGAVLEALEQLEADDIEISYMRVRGFPFHPSVGQFINDHEITFVVEQNRDGQLLKLLTVETGASKDKMTSVKYYGGFSMSAHHVVQGVTEALERAGRVPAGKA